MPPAPLLFTGLLSAEKFLHQPAQAEAIAKQHSANSTDNGLQKLEGELEQGILGCCVNKGTTDCISRDHNESAEGDTAKPAQNGALLKQMPCAQTDDNGLQTVCDQRDKHRGGIKKKITEKGADTADKKGSKRVKEKRRRADYNIAQIEMAARHGNGKGACGRICGKQAGGDCNPACGEAFFRFLELIHKKTPCFLLWNCIYYSIDVDIEKVSKREKKIRPDEKGKV